MDFTILDLPEYLNLSKSKLRCQVWFTEFKLLVFCSNNVWMTLLLFFFTTVVYNVMSMNHRVTHSQFRISQCISSASLMPDSHRHSRFRPGFCQIWLRRSTWNFCKSTSAKYENVKIKKYDARAIQRAQQELLTPLQLGERSI